jgi:hypothetical protein
MPLFQIIIDQIEFFVEANSSDEGLTMAYAAYQADDDTDDKSGCHDISIKVLTSDRVIHRSDVKLREEIETVRELREMDRELIAGLRREWEQMKEERDLAREQRDKLGEALACEKSNSRPPTDR